jgi:hypothetical protein
MILEGQAFLRSSLLVCTIRLNAHPPPPSPISKLPLFLSLRMCVAGRSYRLEGGRRGAELYDRKKALPAIHRSILSVPPLSPSPLSSSPVPPCSPSSTLLTTRLLRFLRAAAPAAADGSSGGRPFSGFACFLAGVLAAPTAAVFPFVDRLV